jgi:hypothetical protein
MNNDSQVDLKTIYAAIREEGFSERTINIINDYTYQILNGKTNLTQFTQAEHAGLCRAGEMLIGAYIVCNYAQASLAAGTDFGASQAGPANWEIDEEQEKVVQQWAEAKQIWYPNITLVATSIIANNQILDRVFFIISPSGVVNFIQIIASILCPSN